MNNTVMSAEEEEQRNNKWIQGKMRNTRKKPFTIEKTRGVYDMSSPVRGWCLIFSNHVFTHLENLLGYERDKENFEKVFAELNFKTVVFEKVTGKEIEANIEKYANISASDGLYPTNALAVVILSHGSSNFICGANYNGKDQKDKIGIDEIDDVISNEKCPQLRGKPKMFFIQACRGDRQDLGLDVLSPQNNSKNVTITTPTAVTTRSVKRLYNDMDEQINKLPSVAEDVMKFYATIPNYASYVPLTGSLFGVQTCVELKRWAWQRNIHDIMLSVNNAIRKKEITITGERSAKQVLELSYTSNTKQLYFNPGYSKKTTSTSSSVQPIDNVQSFPSESNTDVAEVDGSNQENLSPKANEIVSNNKNKNEPPRKRKKPNKKFLILPGQTFIDGFWKEKNISYRQKMTGE